MYCECMAEGSIRCDEELAQEAKGVEHELWFGLLLAFSLALSAAQTFGA